MASDIDPGKTDPRPWQQQPDEGAKAFAAFQQFLEAGPLRELKALAPQLGRSYSLLRRWSARHQWRARARAFDSARGQQAQQEAADSWREFTRTQQRELQRLWRLGVALVQRSVRWDGATDAWQIDPRLGPKEVLSLLKLVAYLLERASAQQSDASTAETSTLELSWGDPEQGHAALTHPGLQRLLRPGPTPRGDPSAPEKEP